MLRRKLQRWNNSLHRDLGYLFFGMTIIYSISGIILNHFKSGDLKHPDYTKSYWEFKVTLPQNGPADKAYIDKVLSEAGESGHYKSHIFSGNSLQIYLTTGSISVDLQTGSAFQEKKKPLYLIKEFNLLHYNNIKKLYTWYSDIYAVALILLAITGLFILRGKNGILGRGAWLTAIGIIIPALFLLFYS
ncbi:MAG: PepSY-associated TM helix domain-containing protein [bacterium]